MNIRTATPDDAEAISALIHLSAHHFVADPGAAVPARFLEGIAVPAIHSRIADPAFRYLIAEEGGALAGAIALQDGRHLYHLFVAAPFRGQGLARALWRAVREGLAPDLRPFTVNASLNAVAVYERLGFAATGPRQERNGIAFVPMAAALAGA